MITRTLSRWLMSIALAILALVAINLLLARPPAQARHAASLINCSGSIQACINAANDGDTILIAAGRYTESLTLSKPVSLTGENRDTTIIHAAEGQRVLTVTGATISNSVVISGLTFTGGSADYGGGMLITDTAQPLIRDSIFINNDATIGGGIYAQSDLTVLNSNIISNTATEFGGGAFAEHAAQVTGGQFTSNTGIALRVFGPLDISDTHFTSNTGSSAGGVDASDSVTITNTRFENNTGSNAGGLYARNGKKILTNTLFINNSGGGLATDYDGAVTIYGGRFERNHTTGGGGAISLGFQTGVHLTLVGTAVFSNTADDPGGGIFLTSGIVNVIDSRFENNAAGGDGGGIAMASGILNSSNSHFENNIANGMGGGIYATFTQLYLTNTQFISNAASYGGGGMQGGHGYVTGGRFERNSVTEGYGGGLQGAEFILSDTIFISNTAAYGGGGASLIGPYIDIRGGHFENNRTLVPSPDAIPCGGGGLISSGLLIITGTQFIKNTSASNGGGICADFDSQVVNAIFDRNVATLNGAAVFFGGMRQYALLHTTIANSGLNPQAAIAVLSGTLNLTNTLIANHAIGISNTAGMVYEDYNLFFNVITNTVDVTSGGHSLIGDPRFVDPPHGDYHLQFSSAAIDHGVDAGVTTDLDGNPRPIGLGFDIGAYEYQNIRYLWLPVIRK
jgi:fibronectin-binding autotransporter adhesin